MWSSVLSEIQNFIVIIWFKIRSSNKWADGITCIFHFVDKIIVSVIRLFVLSIKTLSMVNVLTHRYTSSISLNKFLYLSVLFAISKLDTSPLLVPMQISLIPLMISIWCFINLLQSTPFNLAPKKIYFIF